VLRLNSCNTMDEDIEFIARATYGNQQFTPSRERRCGAEVSYEAPGGEISAINMVLRTDGSSVPWRKESFFGICTRRARTGGVLQGIEDRWW